VPSVSVGPRLTVQMIMVPKQSSPRIQPEQPISSLILPFGLSVRKMKRKRQPHLSSLLVLSSLHSSCCPLIGLRQSALSEQYPLLGSAIHPLCWSQPMLRLFLKSLAARLFQVQLSLSAWFYHLWFLQLFYAIGCESKNNRG